MAQTDKTGARTGGKRWEPGQSGNPEGRPKGSRNKVTLFAEALLEGEASAIIRRLIDGALQGDPACLRLCVDRIAPQVKDRTISLDLPSLSNAGDAVKVMASVVRAVAQGQITPTEGATVASLVDSFRRVLETKELERRILKLESRE